MKCLNCGKEISSNETFCSECGAKQGTETKKKKITYKPLLIIFTIAFFMEIFVYDFFIDRVQTAFSGIYEYNDVAYSELATFLYGTAHAIIDYANIISLAGLALCAIARLQTKSVKGWFFALGFTGLFTRTIVYGIILYLFETFVYSLALDSLSPLLITIVVIEFISLLTRLFIKDNTQTLIS